MMRRFLAFPLLACLALSTAVLTGEVPPPAAAYIMKLAAHPENDRTIFAATHGSGFYRSDDGGDSWQDISPDPQKRHYNIAVFDPNDPKRLFTGGRDSGLWLSEDGGAEWQLASLPNQTILSLIIDPRDSHKLWALTPTGVWRTDSGPGGEWQQVFDYPGFVEQIDIPWPNPDWAVQFTRFQHLTLNPHAPDTIYLGARWEGGYHVSRDGGDTWEHRWIGPVFRRGDRIIPDPTNPQVLFAETHHQGMFKSYNRGQSWVSSSTGIAPQKRTPHYGAVLISGSAFDPTDSTTIYAGSDYSNWKSTDAGMTWSEVGSSLTCEFARSFLVTPHAVYAGTNVGVYRSFDDGKTWTSANRGFPEREIIATTAGKVGSTEFEFAAVKGRPAVFRRALDSGQDWVSVSWLLYENVSDLRFEAESETVVITTPAGEFRSTDAGLRWDVPPTVFAEKPTIREAIKPARDCSIFIAIQGASPPDDSFVDPWYQRPPYISLKVVSPRYPTDGSEPLWRGHWDSQLAGILELPSHVLETNTPLLIRAEVRDFQYGTRVGTTPLLRDRPNLITVDL